MAFHTWLLFFVPLVCAFFIDLVNAVMIPVFLTNFDEGSVFSIEIFSFNENSVTLKLTKWELANLHLPPVTTVTLYQGDAPIDFLCQRLASILTKNPWISSRIIKKITADKVEALAYPKVFEAMDV